MTDVPSAAGSAGRDPLRAELAAEQDVVQPFQLDRTRLRGRMVRLGSALDTILNRHAYPAPVAALLAETITLAATLAATLKYEGVFTLQTKGDGPVGFTVADITSAGELRGYASYDADRLPAEVGADKLRALLGRGHLAFTVDQGEHTERYQGIVSLDGEALEDCVRYYFRQSEQLATGIKSAIGRDQAGRWQGAAILVQALPQEDAGKALDHKPSDLEDDWRRAMLLLGSCTRTELLDPGLPVNDLLYRLFHEERPRVYTRQALRPGCRCSRERVETVLRSLDRGEIESLKVDGTVAVTCEFCNTTYGFAQAELDGLYGTG